ncbi:hypothetical protein [Salinadaptatus halalkaliphilus]|nr:hypothetical protein [Salinadaptatus halalkaliphilus]
MDADPLRFVRESRGIESAHSGILLFGFSVLLSLFMGAVMFINGG